MPYNEPYYVERFEDRGLRLVVDYDHDPINPRKDYDHAATMVCFHGRYNLGDDHDYNNPDHAIEDICGLDTDDLERDDFDATEALNAAPIYWLPLYLYDHSGITMNTTGFSCPWDSGQVGIIYVTKEQADKEWPLQDGETEDQRKERILNYLRGEVAEYDQYLTGDVYFYRIESIDPDEDGDFEYHDSCHGFYGDDAAREAGREAIEAFET